MAVYNKKLWYRRNNTDYSINLYTTIAEVGSEYLAIRDGSKTIYAKIGSVSETNSSHIRVHKNNSTKAILTGITTVMITSSSAWVCPQGVTSISVRAVGPGGNGNSAMLGSAGGAGQEFIGTYSVTPGATYTIIIDASKTQFNFSGTKILVKGDDGGSTKGGDGSSGGGGGIGYYGGNGTATNGSAPSIDNFGGKGGDSLNGGQGGTGAIRILQPSPLTRVSNGGKTFLGSYGEGGAGGGKAGKLGAVEIKY